MAEYEFPKLFVVECYIKGWDDVPGAWYVIQREEDSVMLFDTYEQAQAWTDKTITTERAEMFDWRMTMYRNTKKRMKKGRVRRTSQERKWNTRYWYYTGPRPKIGDDPTPYRVRRNVDMRPVAVVEHLYKEN